MAENSAFRTAVVECLKPYEGNFNYQNMLDGYLDTSPFYAWVDEVARHRPVAGCSVFSSGCGSAQDLWVCMERGAAQACGIEVNEAIALLARKRFAGTPYAPGVQIDTYDGFKLPYADRMFDVVFSLHVVEHTQDPELYLAELFRVLGTGGVLFLDFPNRYYPVEQHSQIPYIHYLPMTLRNWWINLRLSKPLSARLSQDMRYKLDTHRNYHFLSPAQLMQIFRRYQSQYRLQLIEACYHSYSSENVPYRPAPLPYLVGAMRKRTTFRLIAGKI